MLSTSCAQLKGTAQIILKHHMESNKITAVTERLLLAIAVGDALGVPVEFESRYNRQVDPVTGMRGYGTFNQPPGTWSDDFSLTAATVESFIQTGPKQIDIEDLGRRFKNWLDFDYWAVDGVFDVGIATRAAIERITKGCRAEKAGGEDEFDNGNGALMRILPLLLHPLYQHADALRRQKLIGQVASVTHRHPRSTLACFIYLELADQLLHGIDKFEAYAHICKIILSTLSNQLKQEIGHFYRVLGGTLHSLPEHQIQSSGYVVHTLEASIWCLLNNTGFTKSVLAAVNLGGDTDTTAAVVAPLAILAAHDNDVINPDWLLILAKRADIVNLADRFTARMVGIE